MPKSLNIIGCGNLGKTLGLLWNRAGAFDIRGVLNRSTESSANAVKFIGAGEAANSSAALPPAEVWLIATPDGEIHSAARRLADSAALKPGAIVFHCSGSLASDVLAPAMERGAAIASVHPMKSFGDPESSAASFRGTYCGAEGDPEAIRVLSAAFELIGGVIFGISPREKTLYHAAGVMACNYLTALLECSAQIYEEAGLSPQRAFQVMEPLVRGTVDNIFRVGTVDALTGPIARGEPEIVGAQLERLRAFSPDLAELYRHLGVIALELSEKKGAATPQSLTALRSLLEPQK